MSMAENVLNYKFGCMESITLETALLLWLKAEFNYPLQSMISSFHNKNYYFPQRTTITCISSGCESEQNRNLICFTIGAS